MRHKFFISDVHRLLTLKISCSRRDLAVDAINFHISSCSDGVQVCRLVKVFYCAIKTDAIDEGIVMCIAPHVKHDEGGLINRIIVRD